MSHGRSSGFSIEIKSKKYVKDISLSNGRPEAVLIEGDLGPLKDVSFFEDKVLVVKGRYGTLRVELSLVALSPIKERLVTVQNMQSTRKSSASLEGWKIDE